MSEDKKVIYENLNASGVTKKPKGIARMFGSALQATKNKVTNLSATPTTPQKAEVLQDSIVPKEPQANPALQNNTDKPKLLYVITKANWGGAQKYVYDLATHYKETYNVSVAFGKNEFTGKNIFKEKLEEAGIRTIGIEELGRDMSYTQDIASFFKLIGIVFKERPDILHLNSSKIGGMGALAARLLLVKKIIYTAHGLPFFEDRSNFENKAIEFFTRITFSFMHHTILISQFEYNYIKTNWHLSEEKISMIHNAIHPIPFEESIARRSLLRKETTGATQDLLDQPDTLWLTSIGELTGNKGYGFLLHALKELKEKNVPVVFFHFGTGSDEAFLKKESEVLEIGDRVVWKGFSNLAPTYLQSFDAFILPSVKEGLPYTLLEAGQAGIACVGSNVGGIPEIIKSGETGILTEAKNTEQLVAAIQLLQQNPDERKKYGQALQVHVQQTFSMNNMLQKTLEVYQG